MIRIGTLLIALMIGRAYADPSNTPGADPANGAGRPFDQALVTEVYATALAFMAPRTLDPVPVSQLTVWGLRGLTAMDPELGAEMRDNRLRLLVRNRPAFELASPMDEDPRSWAVAAAVLSGVAAQASVAVRTAGAEGVVQNFFDEVFNHLDPYSRYVGPARAREDRDQRNGTAGIGVTLSTVRAGGVEVRTVVSDGPAARAGMRSGDMVVSVNGQPSRGQDAATVGRWVSGPQDTVVTVEWRRPDGRTHRQPLTRAMVPPDTVFPERVGNLLVLRLTSFNYGTDTHLVRALQEGLSGPRLPDGVVIDLRGNRGGVLRQAALVADTLLPPGVVAYTVGRDPAAAHVWTSTGGDVADEIPVVVMVDGRTASAAEVLAAALADRGRAVVVGSTTLGKGLVQTISPLPDGGELFITWSRILAPRQWPLQGMGLMPQVCTSLGSDALHSQLASLADGTQPMQVVISATRAARAPLTPAQILALRAPCPAAEGRDLDMEAARVLVDNPAAYAAALLSPMGMRQSASAPLAQ